MVCVNRSSFGALSGKGSSRRSTWRNWFSRLWSLGGRRALGGRFISLIPLTGIPLELHFQWKVGVEHVQIGEEILTILWVSHD